jgi:hypothetical protein
VPVFKGKQPFWSDLLYSHSQRKEIPVHTSLNIYKITVGQKAAFMRVWDKHITGGLQSVYNSVYGPTLPEA